jgi:DNA-binding NtrC family response regulator
MRPAVLSISTERVVASIRNAVLAHAGYGVIPVTSIESALKILRQRHVCAMIIGQSIPVQERQTLCWEGQRRRVPSVVMDPYEQVADDQSELHINPLDGPEAFLDALATLMQRDHGGCVGRAAASN